LYKNSKDFSNLFNYVLSVRSFKLKECEVNETILVVKDHQYRSFLKKSQDRKARVEREIAALKRAANVAGADIAMNSFMMNVGLMNMGPSIYGNLKDYGSQKALTASLRPTGPIARSNRNINETNDVFTGRKNGKNYVLDRSKSAGNGAYKKASGAGQIPKVDVSKLKESASLPKKGGETVVGHALQKHAGRNPDIWGKIKGNAQEINNTAMKHLEEIVNASGDFKVVETKNGVSFLEKQLPDGRGIRLNMDGSFKGFIDQIR
jgi:hypothetical protein